jgi:hypothetical protein
MIVTIVIVIVIIIIIIIIVIVIVIIVSTVHIRWDCDRWKGVFAHWWSLYRRGLHRTR